MPAGDLLGLWARLTSLAQAATADLVVTDDDVGRYRCETQAGRPFVMVRHFRRHVSLFLLPIAYHPHVIPPELAPRHVGRVTLRFTKEDDPLIEHVPDLLARCRALIGHY